jgi:hypothetical protein
LFSSSFLRLIHCNCGDKSFYGDPDLLFLFFSTVLISPFEFRARTFYSDAFIYICNFRLRVHTFLLVFFDLLAGFWRGQSSCAWLITNGATVQRLQGFESHLIRSPDRYVEYPPIKIYLTYQKIGPVLHQIICADVSFFHFP